MDTTEQTTEGQRTMPEILRDLKIARVAREGLEAELSVVKDEENRIKDELLAGMTAAGIQSGKGSGLKATLVKRASAVIADEAALTAALTELGVLTKYVRLDRAPAAKFALENSLPGVQRDELVTLRIEVVAQ